MLNLEKTETDIITLAIETSCDETSVAVVKNGRDVLSNVISSQIDTHKKFGGVVPEIASRLHLEAINSILKEAVDQAAIKISDIDIIAVTKGPGLIGALLVGISAAKALSYSLDLPLIGVNHMQGHICANYISHKDLEPPFISLVVSGGHTYLIEVKDYQDYEIVGSTRDDACGESFDKVARALGLEYPGGPQIDRLAKLGNKDAIDFPRVMLEKDSYDFSFSGLKTSVLNYINNKKQKNEEIVIADVAASFQEAVIDVLVEKSFRLLEERKFDKLVVSGGVAANEGLKERIKQKAKETCVDVYFPDKILCTDNAAMIACAGFYDYLNGKSEKLDMKVYPNLDL
ncbi:MAG: tRNA (adenosine(37)-N6)-threonylcarbamoyltransferase complex transferase subunit TsaD [Finegoldia sp.]|nr:tRNA (adenosine(37)-N6)-threonylcarbamoyltransferase complex transferase subunit TsaD [Finegoldia sp.]